MDCALIAMSYSTSISNGDFVSFVMMSAKLNTYGLEDEDTPVTCYDWNPFYALDYPNYGFSSTQFGTIMNIDDEGYNDDDYWFEFNAG